MLCYDDDKLDHKQPQSLQESQVRISAIAQYMRTSLISNARR
jgi:hypothetical protein